MSAALGITEGSLSRLDSVRAAPSSLVCRPCSRACALIYSRARTDNRTATHKPGRLRGFLSSSSSSSFCSSSLERTGTGDDVDELVGDGGLTHAVENHAVLVTHLVLSPRVSGSVKAIHQVRPNRRWRAATHGVLGCVLHGVTTSRDLGGVALDETGVDGVGERERAEVAGELLRLDLVRGKGGRLLERLGRVDLESRSLVRDDSQELVVDDLDLRAGEGKESGSVFKGARLPRLAAGSCGRPQQQGR